MGDILTSMIVIAITAVVVIIIFILVNQNMQRKTRALTVLAREKGWDYESIHDALSRGFRLKTGRWVYEMVTVSSGNETGPGSSNMEVKTSWRSTGLLAVTGLVMAGKRTPANLPGPLAGAWLNKMLALLPGNDASRYGVLSEIPLEDKAIAEKWSVYATDRDLAARLLQSEFSLVLKRWTLKHQPVIKVTPDGASFTFTGVKIDKPDEIAAVILSGETITRAAG